MRTLFTSEILVLHIELNQRATSKLGSLPDTSQNNQCDPRLTVEQREFAPEAPTLPYGVKCTCETCTITQTQLDKALSYRTPGDAPTAPSARGTGRARASHIASSKVLRTAVRFCAQVRCRLKEITVKCVTAGTAPSYHNNRQLPAQHRKMGSSTGNGLVHSKSDKESAKCRACYGTG